MGWIPKSAVDGWLIMADRSMRRLEGNQECVIFTLSMLSITEAVDAVFCNVRVTLL
jgi:hypothetical protein